MEKPEPSKLEIEILRVLWARPDGATVRDVQDELNRSKEISFNAVGTTLRRMVEKDLARLADERKPQKFVATYSQEEIYGSIVDEVRQRIFGGSISKLFRSMLGGSRPTAAEADEMQRLIDEHKRTPRGKGR
jgi:BlaI family penicillinase repressor